VIVATLTIERVISGRPRDLGGFSVRRVLPAPGRQTIGPFIFFDHMGPARFEPGQGVDVRPHPHIGLATVTYLFEGAFMHRDSLGTVQLIEPGAVNWMVAGRGIAHSERTPPELRGGTGSALHGIQTWFALPVAHEEDAPSFEHHPAATLPEITLRGVALRVVAGDAYDARSPVGVASPTLYVDARLDTGAELELPDDVEQRAVYVASGALSIDGESFGSGTLVEFTPGTAVTLAATEPVRAMLLGGAPLDGPRHIWWNFVSSSRERIERAKTDWREQRFVAVPGDAERIPLPDR
jgi:redox-sensitive bicupin YhaK (pirin superfamily)